MLNTYNVLNTFTMKDMERDSDNNTDEAEEDVVLRHTKYIQE